MFVFVVGIKAGEQKDFPVGLRTVVKFYADVLQDACKLYLFAKMINKLMKNLSAEWH